MVYPITKKLEIQVLQDASCSVFIIKNLLGIAVKKLNPIVGIMWDVSFLP